MNFDEQLHELIAERALELSLQRDNGSGNPKDDWIQAEQEIRHELTLRSDRLTEKFGITQDY